jgi:hypothetical protein
VASRLVPIFVALVIGLVAGFGVSYAVSSNQLSSLQNNLTQANDSNAMLRQEIQNATSALPLKPQSGQMVRTAWVFISPVGTGDYAIFVHAEGLEPPASGAYIVEGVMRGGAMNIVPIGANATASEFEPTANGAGNYWTVLMQNPSSSFEAIDLFYLPGMDMSHAALVATVQLG